MDEIIFEVLKVIVGFAVGWIISKVMSDRKLDIVLKELDLLKDQVRILSARYEGIQQLRSDLRDLEKRVSNNEIKAGFVEARLDKDEKQIKYNSLNDPE